MQLNIKDHNYVLEGARVKDYLIFDDINKEMEIGDIHWIIEVNKNDERSFFVLTSLSGQESNKYFDELTNGNWYFLKLPTALRKL